MLSMVQSKLNHTDSKDCWQAELGGLRRRFQLDLELPDALYAS